MSVEKSIRFVMLVSPADERMRNAELIKQRIPNLELVHADIHKIDLFQTHLDVLRTDDSYQGVVMMEDDIKLSEDFERHFDRVMKEHSGDIVQFFEYALAKKPPQRGWQAGGNFYSCVCYYMPSAFSRVLADDRNVSDFKAWYAKRGEKWTYPIDTYIQYVLRKSGMIYWREIPYIVQHLDFKSMMGPRSSKRQSKFFIDDIGR